MKRVFIPYYQWECYNNGMWSNNNTDLDQAIKFTSDHIEYGNYMRIVVVEWPNTMLNFLTNSSTNHRAHIGHCACAYAHGLSEKTVRTAWKLLTESQRKLANIEADRAYLMWKAKYINTLLNGSKDAIKEAYQMRLQLS